MDMILHIVTCTYIYIYIYDGIANTDWFTELITEKSQS